MSRRYNILVIASMVLVIFVLGHAEKSYTQPTAQWDTVGTSAIFDGVKGIAAPEDEVVGLAVSNFGEYGMNGIGGVNLDYFLSGEECGTRPEDRVYLRSGSPFLLIASESGPNPTSVSLTTSIYQLDFSKEYSWVPDENIPVIPGLSSDGIYDSVFVGRMYSRDSSIAIERTYFALRNSFDNFTSVLSYILLFSADGQTHNHVTFGDVVDWDIPSDSATYNVAGASISGNFTYLQGLDSLGHEDPLCLNQGRYGAIRTVQQFYCSDFESTNTEFYWNSLVFDRSILDEVSLDLDNLPIVPPAPDAKSWWKEIHENPGTSGNTAPENYILFNTFTHDITVGPQDSLGFWTVLSTVRNGTLPDLEYMIGETFHAVVGEGTACCAGVRGDANCNGEIAISDIGALVDYLFITGDLFCCLEELDANASGGYTPQPADITIADIGIIVDKLFISGTEPVICYDGWPPPRCTSFQAP